MGGACRVSGFGLSLHRKGGDFRPWGGAGLAVFSLVQGLAPVPHLCSDLDAPPTCPQVPYFVPDTPAARADLAAQYTTIGRMDQGKSGSWAAGEPQLGAALAGSGRGLPSPLPGSGGPGRSWTLGCVPAVSPACGRLLSCHSSLDSGPPVCSGTVSSQEQR